MNGGSSSSSPSAPDGLYYNPFSDSVDDDVSFTSGIQPASASRRILRRRGSDGAQHSRGDGGGSTHTAHSRARTVDDASDKHPLRRSSNASFRSTRASTRPRLARALPSSDDDTPRASLSTSSSHIADSRSPIQDGQRIVLVHKVTATDSLPGVALKYGIALADLRRANQLWTSDSIHLRKTLYIPVDQARHARLALIDSPATEDPPTTLTLPSHVRPSTEISSSPHPDSAESYTIHRVPAARLSYFPPPNHDRPNPNPNPNPNPKLRPSASTSNSTDSIHSPSWDARPDPFSASAATLAARFTSTASTLRNTALSSLFSALPLAASTRDDLFTRLSIDSSASSATGSDEHEHEHELAPVPPTPKPKPSPPAGPTPPIPFVSPKRAPTRVSSISSHRKGKTKKTDGEDAEHIPLATSPQRAQQMQPTPGMLLPDGIARSVSSKSQRAVTTVDVWSGDSTVVR
ncbi:hypothetical protein OF83DRAFT_1170717 [Amylostereum chailletii]|nr:hypothetical protein OF83DRAFT_1170717 [Amylostereum chailletii]